MPSRVVTSVLLPLALRPRAHRCAPALAVLALVGCQDKPSEPPARAPERTTTAAAPPAPTTPAATAPAAAGGELTWQRPDGWQQVDNPSPMRKATYKIPKAEGDPEDGELSVTQVGGGVEANIQRWEGQFEEAQKAKTSDKQVGGLTVTMVELGGTFKGGGPMMGGGAEPKKDWKMLAAIAHTKPEAHFFKLTGPKKTVEGARADFDVLVGSFVAK